MARREVICQRPAQRMSDERGPIDLESADHLVHVFDKRLDGILPRLLRLVRESMPLEVERNCPKSGCGNGGHDVAEDVRGTSPAVNHQRGGSIRITAFYRANCQARAQSRIVHPIAGTPGGKHLAGTKVVSATMS